jgi:hypothetical protein
MQSMKKLKFYFFIISSLIAITPFLSVYASYLSSSEMSGDYKEYLLELEKEISRIEKHPFAYYEVARIHEYSIGHWAVFNDLDPTGILKNLVFMLHGYIRMLFAHKEHPEFNEMICKIIKQINKIDRSNQLISRQKDKGFLFKDGKNEMLDEVYYALMRILELYNIEEITKQTHKILEDSYDSRYGKPVSYKELFERSNAFPSGKFSINPEEAAAYIDALHKSQNAGLINIQLLINTEKYGYTSWIIHENCPDGFGKSFFLYLPHFLSDNFSTAPETK